jgi:uncharacterized protein (DUF427 family)
MERTSKRIEVVFAGEVIADTRRAFRILETSHPPTYYIPPDDVRRELLVASKHRSFCEWKGQAHYWTVRVGRREASDAAWSYPELFAPFEEMVDYLAFYCAAMDVCRVDGEVAQPQPGAFYGGWITPDVVGPFKGEPGSWGW